jgi:CheY-like chemotaxis protein
MSGADMGMGHILVVDDEPQIWRVMCTTLVAQGYEVSDARSAAKNTSAP